MPLQSTSGAASQDGFGGNGVAVVPNYIEDVFSTYVYTGNGATQTITNGIDLSTKGGLVWLKQRSGATSHILLDTARGASNTLCSNGDEAQNGLASASNTFNTTGFSLLSTGANSNGSGATYGSWTFRKQPKFFDVVTWTGNGASDRQISHSLGSTPGFIVYKCTSTTGDWNAIARITNISYSFGLKLNKTNAQYVATNPSSTISTTWFVPEYFNGSIPDSNANGETYVAYLFAHDAGGFGLTGTDNVISCGSYVGDGSGNAVVNLGYEPQFLLVKLAQTFAEEWRIFDIMRGWDNSTSQGSANQLVPNTTAAETTRGGWKPTATGFEVTSQSSGLQVIYIAIRRGPMKVPTLGTSVYGSSLLAGNSSTQQVTGLSFPPDLVMTKARDVGYGNRWTDRLRGFGRALSSDTTSTELNNTTIGVNPFNMDGYTLLGGNPYNASGYNYVNHAFCRAPSFFDEVCYTGTGTATRALTHNLGAVPEMMIVKSRSDSSHWMVYVSTLGNTKQLQLERTNASATNTDTWGSTTPTSTQFTVGCIPGIPDTESTNDSGYTYVAYLFATCAGVSKVGSYTGNGTTQTINCGFTGGARFVMIKRTDSTGNWYVYDTARGMTVLTDPYLLFNDVATEVATLGSVTTVSTGFALNSAILADINVNAGTYIFLAIA